MLGQVGGIGIAIGGYFFVKPLNTVVGAHVRLLDDDLGWVGLRFLRREVVFAFREGIGFAFRGCFGIRLSYFLYNNTIVIITIKEFIHEYFNC